MMDRLRTLIACQVFAGILSAAVSAFAHHSMAPGDKLTIYMAPLKSGEKGGSLNAVVLANGKMLGRHGLEVEGAAAQ